MTVGSLYSDVLRFLLLVWSLLLAMRGQVTAAALPTAVTSMRPFNTAARIGRVSASKAAAFFVALHCLISFVKA